MTTKRLVILALLTSISLVIFILEAQIPPIVPIPGVKMGLANIITLVTLVWYGRRDAFLVLMLRIILGSIFAGTGMSFIYSVSGGLLCFFAMALMPVKRLWIVSIFGAAAHNIGQLTAAAIVTSQWMVFGFLPVLIISAVITGAFTGLCATAVTQSRYLNAWRARNEN